MAISRTLMAAGTIVLAYLLSKGMPSNFITATIDVLCLGVIIIFLRRIWDSNGLSLDHQPKHDNETASQPETLKPIKLKLLVDKNKNQVVFAECDKHFVDVLLSFLMLPMGRIISLSNKESGIGSMDGLYKSIEGLNIEHFRTQACKNMLLNPRSAYGLLCNNLVVKIDETDYTKSYTCYRTPCPENYFCRLVSLVENSICSCGTAMTNELQMCSNWKVYSFLDSVGSFIVSDDLMVLPATIDNTRWLLARREIEDDKDVQECNINIGLEEVLKLLYHSLVSKTPLTDVFLPKSSNINIAGSPTFIHKHHQSQSDNISVTNARIVELWFSKSTNRVICIEADGDFVDFLFSFLTMPLGSIIKLLNVESSLGSIYKLYKSAEILSSVGIVYARCKGMLLSPKLECMFGCENQLISVEEEVTPPEFISDKCYSCRIQRKWCPHHIPFQRFRIMNPKIPGANKPGGGFVRKQGQLLVTDNLVVEPLSPVSHVKKLGIPFSDLEHIQVRVGKKEALNLLKAALTSKSVLTQAFSSQVINRRNGNRV